MKTLDRYIIKSFLTSAMLWFIVLMSLRVVIDLFVNMDEFTEDDASLMMVIAQAARYYGANLLVYFTELGGVIIVVSATFTVAMMSHTNELTAILASGLSPRRVVLPIVLFAFLLGGLIVLDYELLIPRVSHILVRTRDYKPVRDEFQIRLLTDGANSVWHGGMYVPSKNKITNYVVVMMRDENRTRLGEVTGSEAEYGDLDGQVGWWISHGRIKIPADETVRAGDPTCEKIWTRTAGPKRLKELSEQGGRKLDPGEWVKNVDMTDETSELAITARRFTPSADPSTHAGGTLEKPKFTVHISGRNVGTFEADRAVWTHSNDGETYWALQGGRLFYPTDLTPEELTLLRSRRWLNYMSIAKLTRMLQLDRVSDRSAAELTRHIRVTEPLNNIVMLLLGLPFILSRERNIKASVTLCVLTCAMFYAFIYVCRYVGLPPEFAAWLPILLFGPIAVVMYDSVKT